MKPLDKITGFMKKISERSLHTGYVIVVGLPKLSWEVLFAAFDEAQLLHKRMQRHQATCDVILARVIDNLSCSEGGFHGLEPVSVIGGGFVVVGINPFLRI